MLMQRKNLKETALPGWAKLWELCFAALFIYTFFVQNVIISVGGLLILLSAVLAVFAVLDLLICRKGVLKGNCMWGIAAFVLLGMLSSLLFSYNLNDSLNAGLRMIEYLLVACSLYSFLTSYPQRMFSILRYIWVSITLLCIGVLLNGTKVTGAGAIGLESLNVNLLASFITVQICLSFILLEKTKKAGKMLYSASIILALFVQVLSASRRGFIVACVFCAAAVFGCVIPRYTEKRSSARLCVYGVILAISVIVLINAADYIMNETVLGMRFLGNFNSGDALREKYRSIALQEFKKNPVFGVGLNGLTSVMGVYSHSLYYETLACTGTVGAILLLSVLVTLGKGLCRNLFGNASKHPSAMYISKLAFGLFSVLLVSGFAVTMIYDFYFYICLAILAAIALMNEEMCNNCVKTEF